MLARFLLTIFLVNSLYAMDYSSEESITESMRAAQILVNAFNHGIQKIKPWIKVISKDGNVLTESSLADFLHVSASCWGRVMDLTSGDTTELALRAFWPDLSR